MNPLLGAVADAQEVKRYLTLKLRVPEKNVQTLLDKQATRSNIIDGIRGLANNPLISHNDPILIFYAGHGTEAPSPNGWYAQRSKVQSIVPQDYGEIKGGKRVHCIPDRSIGILLQELANAKGDNIVVIFDCCHSGSGTRDGSRRVRSVRVSEDIPEDLDIEIWGRKNGENADVPAEASGSSHVLLAACASNQSAIENNRQGLFTRALLEAVSEIGFRNLTYASLIRHLPDLPGQVPRCEGNNRDRLWFTTTVKREEPFYEVKTDDEDYILEAGSVHGITEGSDFSLYKESKIGSTRIGKATVLSVNPSNSIVELSGDITGDLLPAFATQIMAGAAKALRVHLIDDPKVESLRRRLEREAKSSPHLYALADAEDAKFHIGVHEDTATFTFENSLIKTLALGQISSRVRLWDEDTIMRVIAAASLFNRYLSHRPDGLDIDDQVAEQSSKRPVDIYYTRLEKKNRKWFEAVKDGENLNRDNQVDVISGETRYGLKITNNTKEDLYPYLFLFNCSDLSIESYYTPPVVKNMDQDAPLRKGESITVGYGDGGPPWRHRVQPAKGAPQNPVVRDAEDLQIEFFKLILTTRPVDLSFMKQLSPFESGRAERDPPKPVDMWMTELLTVVVRKEAAQS
ncbi:hypothetical protein FRC14_003630 [Serendipita sp. 396]|nr:hypothetical protein FRC14_003630 [Serendipita sp. 396]KAG8825576.1 hypothetical protein FRC19_011108 [Serendipita sp. 401]KAG8867365.1 hypothetical protein FRC20_005964 [Serendipita sp. 405]KAG9055561.1 hypothetical protein FS842_001878 [Serendipita sp. 407]